MYFIYSLQAVKIQWKEHKVSVWRIYYQQEILKPFVESWNENINAIFECTNSIMIRYIHGQPTFIIPFIVKSNTVYDDQILQTNFTILVYITTYTIYTVAICSLPISNIYS